MPLDDMLTTGHWSLRQDIDVPSTTAKTGCVYVGVL